MPPIKSPLAFLRRFSSSPALLGGRASQGGNSAFQSLSGRVSQGSNSARHSLSRPSSSAGLEPALKVSDSSPMTPEFTALPVKRSGLPAPKPLAPPFLDTHSHRNLLLAAGILTGVAAGHVVFDAKREEIFQSQIALSNEFLVTQLPFYERAEEPDLSQVRVAYHGTGSNALLGFKKEKGFRLDDHGSVYLSFRGEGPAEEYATPKKYRLPVIIRVSFPKDVVIGTGVERFEGPGAAFSYRGDDVNKHLINIDFKVKLTDAKRCSEWSDWYRLP